MEHLSWHDAALWIFIMKSHQLSDWKFVNLVYIKGLIILIEYWTSFDHVENKFDTLAR